MPEVIGSTLYAVYVMSISVLCIGLAVSCVVASTGLLCSGLASLFEAMLDQRRLDRETDHTSFPFQRQD